MRERRETEIVRERKRGKNGDSDKEREKNVIRDTRESCSAGEKRKGKGEELRRKGGWSRGMAEGVCPTLPS